MGWNFTIKRQLFWGFQIRIDSSNATSAVKFSCSDVNRAGGTKGAFAQTKFGRCYLLEPNRVGG